MSGNKLASAHVELSANTAAFQGDMGKAALVAQRETERISRSAKQMALLVAGATVASGLAFAAMAREHINAADEMKDLSARVGMSAEKLAAYSYAARMSGADTQAIADGVKKLNENMVDAARGQGTAQVAFAELGVKVRDANGNLKSNDDIMREVAARLSGMADGAHKTALAVDIFGRAGADLIPMLNEGAVGLEAMAEEGRRLGQVLSEDAYTAAAEFNDNVDRLTMGLSGMAAKATAELLPALNATARALSDENSLLRESMQVLAVAGTTYAGVTLAVNGKVIALRAATAAQVAFNRAVGANPYVLAATAVAGLAAAFVSFSDDAAPAIQTAKDFDAQLASLTGNTKALAAAQNDMRLAKIQEEIRLRTEQVTAIQQNAQRSNAALGQAETQRIQELQRQLAALGQAYQDVQRQASGAGAQDVVTPPQSSEKGKSGSKPRDNFDYGGLNFGELDAMRAEEAASAAAFIEREKQAAASAVQSIQQSMLSKRELIDQDFLQQRLQLQQAAEFELLTEQQKSGMLLALQEQHKAKIKALDDAELERKRAQNQATIGFFNNGLSTIANSQGKYAKQAAALQKAQSLLKIGQDTRAAAMGAYAALAGIPIVGPALGVAAAGAAIAFGAAQAAAVGGSVGGTSTPSAPVTPTAAREIEPAYAQQERTSQQTTIVKIESDQIFLGRQLVDLLNEVTGDGKGTQVRYAIA